MLWISTEQSSKLIAGETDAYRLGTGPGGWIERFGEDCLISAVSDDAADRMQRQLSEFCIVSGWSPRRLFYRRLVKQPGESDVPVLLDGPVDLPTVVEISENGLRAHVDLQAGYSVGWFCDQRHNRAWLEAHARPATVLNCFAYTGAFSLAAARAGAITTSVDLAKKSLQRARENFSLNHLDQSAHRFIADDVFAVLPRLARRGESYDAVVLDPPTFSRGAGGRVFRVERDFGDLLMLAVRILNPNGWILLSTNSSSLDVGGLLGIAGEVVGSLKSVAVACPAEYPAGSASSTVWIQPNSL